MDSVAEEEAGELVAGKETVVLGGDSHHLLRLGVQSKDETGITIRTLNGVVRRHEFLSLEGSKECFPSIGAGICFLDVETTNDLVVHSLARRLQHGHCPPSTPASTNPNLKGLQILGVDQAERIGMGDGCVD